MHRGGLRYPQRARGWCPKHYYRWKRTGTTDDPPPSAQGCLVEGCHGSHSAHGYCNKHASRWRVHGDPLGGAAFRGRNVGDCAVPDCNQPSRKRGWCTLHYQRWANHGDPLALAPRPQRPSLPCQIDGCSEAAWPSGLCVRHYQAQYRAAHREKARATTAKWRAENPERHRENLARWRTIPENQQLARERTRVWLVANPKRRAEQSARRNALKRSGQATRISMKLLEAKLAYWGWRCWIAGPSCTGDPEQWDHVKPLSKRGAHLLANLRPACRPCNNRKGAQWPFPTA
jgi:5-methylcytosine-specific restriction endonuclease McrA